MSLAIRRVAILPGEGAFVPDGFLVIDGERISALGPGNGPDSDVVWNAPGLVATPGLINAHTHLALTAFRGIADDLRLFEFLAETRKRWGTATEEQVLAATRAGCVAAVASGTTCLCDSHATSPRPVAAAAREVGVRLVGAASVRSTWFGAPAQDTLPALLREADAAAAEHVRGDLLYVPSFAAHSPYHCTPEQIRRVKAICRDRGWLFQIHLAECDEEARLVRQWTGMTPTAYLESLGVLDQRTLLAHAVCLEPEDIRRIAAAGSSVAHCPKSNAKLGDGIAPIPDCLQAGVQVALGTDSMVSNNNLDMVEEMRFSVLIHRGARRDPTAMTARTAFQLATLAGARALGLDDEIGSLRPGKRADVVLFALAPPRGLTEDAVLSELVFHATSDAVRAVIVNGQVILQRDGAFGMRSGPGRFASRGDPNAASPT